jgi:protein-L-isoaspartate(D-aspartate) O-methyltransferase
MPVTVPSTPMDRDELLDALRRRRLDPRVLDAVAAVPRERFVPPSLRRRAYEDGALPIASGQTISQPSLVAYMVALLDVHENDRVLDVGTGSGYHAAVLAQLAGHVYGVELQPELADGARAALARLGAANVTVRVGDGARGWPDEAPFDRINVAAACERRLPRALLDQLADGGRLVAPVRNGDERLVVLRRRGDRLERSEHGSVRFVPLVQPEAG